MKDKIEELIGSVKTLTSQNDALSARNATLEKELNAIKDSSAMIFDAGKEQHKKDLDKFLRERKRALDYENAAAAKILKLEEEVASLQDALTAESAQGEETQAEMRRFMKAQKARRGRAESFHVYTDDEAEGEEDAYLEGERPLEQDEGAVYEADDDAEDAETLGR